MFQDLKARTDMRKVKDDSIPCAPMLFELLASLQLGCINAEENGGSGLADRVNVLHQVGVLLLRSLLRVVRGRVQELRCDNRRLGEKQSMREREVTCARL